MFHFNLICLKLFFYRKVLWSSGQGLKEPDSVTSCGVGPLGSHQPVLSLLHDSVSLFVKWGEH